MRALLAISILAACGNGSAVTVDAPLQRTFGGSRPTDLKVPMTLDPSLKYPLVMVLHGYGATGLLQESYFELQTLVTNNLAFVLAPDGLVDSKGAQYWNADPACCDLDHANPDDSGYLSGLISDVSAVWPIDPAAVFVIGHSNGGFMSYRMACDHADQVASIVVLAGAASTDPAACVPSQHVNVLHLHGTDDAEVPYGGTPPSPGAIESATRWAGYDGCQTATTQGTPMDLDQSVTGAETQPETFGCTAPIDVELWTLNGSSHIPSPTSAFEPAIWSWLDAHHR